MSLRLIPDSDPILHQRAGFINAKNPELDLHQITGEMLQLMFYEQGIGLAAPQVGIPKRLFVLCIDERPLICINPKITKLGKRNVLIKEGCLSYPGEYIDVMRPDEIKAEWIDLTGRWQKEVMTGMWARAFQHELDHLNGIVFKERAHVAE